MELWALFLGEASVFGKAMARQDWLSVEMGELDLRRGVSDLRQEIQGGVKV